MRELLLRGALSPEVPTQLFLDALRVYVGKSPIYLTEESGPDKLFAVEQPEPAGFDDDETFLSVGDDAHVRVAA